MGVDVELDKRTEAIKERDNTNADALKGFRCMLNNMDKFKELMTTRKK